MRADVAPRPEPAAVPLVLIGRSAAARRLADDIAAAARASGVLIEGEPGMDAGELALAIHARSGRRGCCVVVGCAMAEPAAVERELFGDAPRREAADVESVAAGSALARARRGTLYLEDMAELSAAAQSRLARVARDGEVRIGGAIARLEAAFVGGTTADPDADVAEGRLRRDLFRHLARRRIRVPGLRRRADDIPHMLEALVGQHAGDVASPRTLAPAAITLLTAMPWPGNVVELRHVIARLLAASTRAVIGLEDVLAHVGFEGTLAPHAPAGTLRAARQQFERDYIALVLHRHRGRVGDAARELGIQRTNLYRKARQLGIAVARPAQD